MGHKFWVIPLLLLSIGLLNWTLNAPHLNLKNSVPSVQEWQECVDGSNILTCDEDSISDLDDCYNASSATSLCFEESSPSASQSCLDWWIYFEEAQASDILPDSFFSCSQACYVQALQNTFYFENTFTPFWLTCALTKNN